MRRNIILIGIIFACTSVILGAFGAHALKALIPPEKLVVFETGVRYQFMHSIALIVLFLYAQNNAGIANHLKWIHRASFAFVWGICLFSGSLYLIALQPLCSFNYTLFIGPVTPLGGLCFILGWSFWAKHTVTLTSN